MLAIENGLGHGRCRGSHHGKRGGDLLLGQQNLYEQPIGDAVGSEGRGHWRAGKASSRKLEDAC